MKEYKVNKDKCVGCGTCAAICPEGAELKDDNKAKIISSAKIEDCGGADICPYEAIEEVNGVKLEDDDDER